MLSFLIKKLEHVNGSIASSRRIEVARNQDMSRTMNFLTPLKMIEYPSQLSSQQSSQLSDDDATFSSRISGKITGRLRPEFSTIVSRGEARVWRQSD